MLRDGPESFQWWSWMAAVGCNVTMRRASRLKMIEMIEMWRAEALAEWGASLVCMDGLPHPCAEAPDRPLDVLPAGQSGDAEANAKVVDGGDEANRHAGLLGGGNRPVGKKR